ncbi:MAG: hypothetical protein IJE51_05115 [Clostridia bacterium]|nr:hypothetical protein [Clostridia bacterium]
MKRFLSLFVLIAVAFSMCIPTFAAENGDLFDDWQLMEKIAGKFFDSYLKSIYIDETLPVDYSDFVDNENLINYMEAKKDVYRLTEKYFGDVVDFSVDFFTTGSTEPYVHGDFCDTTIYIYNGKFNNSEGENLNLVGSMVFTFIEIDGELKIYGVYSRDVVDRSVRGYDRYGTGKPTIYSDLSDELNAFASEFEADLAYYSENRAQIEADKVYCTELAIDYLQNYYDELYSPTETDGIFEHKLEIETGELASYLQKIAYYDNSPKRYGEDVFKATYEFELFEIQFWKGKIYLEIMSDVTTYNKIYEKMPLRNYRFWEFFTFVKNEDGEYVLRDLYRDSNSGRTFDVQNRELPYFDIVFEDYMMVEPVVDYELIKLLDEEQFAYDAELREAFENKEEREAKEAAEKEAELDERLTELSQKDWVHEDRFPANYETQNPELLEEENEILSNKVFIVLIVGSFAFSAVAAALSFILVLKKK